MNRKQLKSFGIKRVIFIKQIDNWAKGKRYIVRTLLRKYLVYKENNDIVSIYRLKGYKKIKVV